MHHIIVTIVTIVFARDDVGPNSGPSGQGIYWLRNIVAPVGHQSAGHSPGLIGILIVSVWTSYNCWTVTKIKRFIERSVLQDDEDEDDSENEAEDDETSSPRNGSRTGTSVASCSNATAGSNTTYPDVGKWAYGRRFHNCEYVLPGDSPILRAGLVLATYLVAILVPNVQSLVALVGAVTGSSTALLIPPILELAYIRHMEAKEVATG
jgi:proton-coupled amino acid transporter